MNADDITVLDMLNSMSDAEWRVFADDHRAKIWKAIVIGHYSHDGPDWDKELAEYQQAVRDGQAEARHMERVFQESKGVHDG